MNITHTTIKVAWIGALCTLNIVTNGIVVAVIAKYPRLREDRTNIFMLSVMMADMLFGILVMPLSAVVLTKSRHVVLEMDCACIDEQSGLGDPVQNDRYFKTVRL